MGATEERLKVFTVKEPEEDILQYKSIIFMEVMPSYALKMEKFNLKKQGGFCQ